MGFQFWCLMECSNQVLRILPARCCLFKVQTQDQLLSFDRIAVSAKIPSISMKLPVFAADHQKLLLPNAVFHSAPVSAPCTFVCFVLSHLFFGFVEFTVLTLASAAALLVSFVPPAVDIQALVQAAAPTLDSSATSTRPRPARARRS